MGWLVAAFAIVWLAFFLYAFNIDRQQKAISNEIADLTRRLSQKS